VQTNQHEFATKLEHARALLARHKVDGLLLRRVSSFAWATCGAASYVNTATSEGAASLLITPNDCFLVTNNIEAPRLEEESLLREQGWEFRVSHWTNPMVELNKLIEKMSLVADVPFAGAKDISGEMARIRATLTPEEGHRLRNLGKLCSQAMDAAAKSVRPGMTEYEIAAGLASETQKAGVQPIVNLIATDERIYKFRHPLPTEKRLNKYAMLVLSGRKYGLVCSISRLVHFGRVPEDVQKRVEAAAYVNTAFIGNTRPGNSLENILINGQASYAETGFADEWRFHHQGGAIGYEPREMLGLPGSKDFVAAGQAYAWNPTISGAKMEDTILVGPQTNEILTSIPGWPVRKFAVKGQAVEIECPMVLEME